MSGPAASIRVLLAGGGSGGHVLPALAVAEALGADATCVAACSRRAVDAEILSRAIVDHDALPAAPFGLRPLALARCMRGLGPSVRTVRRRLAADRIDVVLATGGFVTPPVALAAWSRGVPLVLLALDAVPGRATRAAAGLADCRIRGLPAPPGRAGGSFGRAEVTGVPIRRDAIATGTAGECRERLGLDPGRPTLLVTGASQGARTLDHLATDIAAAASCPLDGWQVLHLVGGGDLESVRDLYAAAGVPGRVERFLPAMGDAWGAASLAISRAGAGSVAEAAGNRVPTVFLPYPWHRDHHQAHNAAPLVNTGGASLATDRIDRHVNMGEAGELVMQLLSDRARRDRMRASLHTAPEPSAAARRVADIVRRIAAETQTERRRTAAT